MGIFEGFMNLLTICLPPTEALLVEDEIAISGWP